MYAVPHINGNLEHFQDIRDFGVYPSTVQYAPDLSGQQACVAELRSMGIGDVVPDYSVLAVYDSRPVNAQDFTFSGDIGASKSTLWSITSFEVPAGYRAVIREFMVYYDSPGSGPAAESTASLWANGANVPFNQNIIVGNNAVIPTFFVLEEFSSFGVTGINGNLGAGGSTVAVSVYGNLIPVTDEQLPFTVANPVGT